MRCPLCGSDKIGVYGTEAMATDDFVSAGLVKRWRVCHACGARWRTFEEWDRREVWRRVETGREDLLDET